LKEATELSSELTQSDPRYLKIKTDVSQFIAETIGKDTYSKKKEEDNDNKQGITVNIVSSKPDMKALDTPNMAQPSHLTPSMSDNTYCTTRENDEPDRKAD
jgi:hypothetical protein